ncbi:unnamed protein product [Haemonchus placei]|uniref:Transposase n=1 Tax=Haemonchus placei TaxID=6290 RepID=A0A0N4WPI8_HAEPC|nr:unnamed protein product [Haemonchus placei]
MLREKGACGRPEVMLKEAAIRKAESLLTQTILAKEIPRWNTCEHYVHIEATLQRKGREKQTIQ